MSSNTRPPESFTGTVQPLGRRHVIWITLIVAVVAGVWTWSLTRSRDPAIRGVSRDASELPARFSLDLTRQFAVDPELITYQREGDISISLNRPTAIAVGTDDQIYVCGDAVVHVLDVDGKWLREIAVSGPATSLAVAVPPHPAPGTVFVAVGEAIEVYAPNGQLHATWQLPGDEPKRITSLAAGADELFVADAAHQVIWRLDAQGQVGGRIGQSSTAQVQASPIVPSAHLDVVIGSDDLVHVTNPGRLQVATYSRTGELGPVFGSAGGTIEAFFGCCNPAHLAMLPTGEFVTSEQGLPRIKIFDASGHLASVVAGPPQLDVPLSAIVDPRRTGSGIEFDIAVTSRGDVLALDTQNRRIICFSPRT